MGPLVYVNMLEGLFVFQKEGPSLPLDPPSLPMKAMAWAHVLESDWLWSPGKLSSIEES